MPVSKSLRFQILRRDNHACRYCGTAASPERALTVDHVVPVALGGSDAPDNLVAACRDCNAGKSATPADAALVADVSQDAIRWSKAMHAAREQAIQDHDQMSVWQDRFYDYWTDYTFITPTYRGGSGKPETFSLPHDWRVSIASLVADGMFAGEMRDAVDVAMSRKPDDKFRYFIGVIRNKLADRQETARSIAVADDAPPRAKFEPDDHYAIYVGRYLGLVCDNF